MVKLWRITYKSGFTSSYKDILGDDITKVIIDIGKYLKEYYTDTTLENVTNIELRGDTGND